ncbi:MULTISPECIES: SixA phosphatase family protein [Flagellimonas]|uniref:Histidine phosphatase family protein n=1 Tax=Flagellimonas hadalis TaxID=2597517 RepID=A0A5N5IPU5_9FLAO|nr:histidine phosphatase family protein [Allomuricauda hadalis]KAB5485656.1 histidine phosphatase family protein [Allomuricauda hadalis]RUA14595.1 MAG: histidine phosphatase family protein [Flavobacteriia bacterium]
MKQLILMRHAKSSWDYEVSDKDRPLLQRGINDAHLVSKTFKAHAPKLDFIYSSPAIRALHTSMIFVRNFDYDLAHFRVDKSLYDFSGDSVQRFVEQLDNGLETVALFGHNYAFTSLANAWGDQYIDNVPTAGLVHITFGVDDWSKISKGTTKQMVFPKQLR